VWSFQGWQHGRNIQKRRKIPYRQGGTGIVFAICSPVLRSWCDVVPYTWGETGAMFVIGSSMCRTRCYSCNIFFFFVNRIKQNGITDEFSTLSNIINIDDPILSTRPIWDFFCLTPVTACRAFLFSRNSFARACEAFPAAVADLIWVLRSSRSSCAVWRSEAFLLRPSLRLRLLWSHSGFVFLWFGKMQSCSACRSLASTSQSSSYALRVMSENAVMIR